MIETLEHTAADHAAGSDRTRVPHPAQHSHALCIETLHERARTGLDAGLRRYHAPLPSSRVKAAGRSPRPWAEPSGRGVHAPRVAAFMPLGSRRSCHNALVEPLTEIAVRRLEEIVPQLMAEEPVVVLNGPRTVGKSTLLHRLAAGVNRRVLDLDDVATRALVRQDLGLYLTGEPPVLIDEFQHVPEILDAIKAELNRDLRPGRFVLTGSTRYSTLPRAAQSLTGRVHLENVWPLSQGELAGIRERFVQRLLDDPAHLVSPEASRATREEYVERVLAGGLPVALRRRPGRSRSRWFEDYLTLIVERDVLEISSVRQSATLPLLLRRLAAQTAQVLNIAHASREAGITTSVGEDYVRLLESVFLVHRLPAWGTTLTVRVNRLPKIHLVDSGLAGWLLGLTGASVGRRIPAGAAQAGGVARPGRAGRSLPHVGRARGGSRPGDGSGRRGRGRGQGGRHLSLRGPARLEAAA
jgi:uncharacterized protein